GKIAITDLGKDVPALLETIQSDLYKRAEEKFKSHTIKITEWDNFVPALNDKNVCLIPHCLEEKCEDEIKELSARKAAEESDEPEDAKAPSMGAKSLCIPFKQPPDGIAEGTKWYRKLLRLFVPIAMMARGNECEVCGIMRMGI
ncbi:MAG: hypothetical protein Q9184_006430, partial [Pyrenodesmia sp. 2 TL-2023]